ncbi:MAG TPA: WYL domain-containing protein, partial [Dongiaceae bacterium]
AALPDAKGWRRALVPIEGLEQAAAMLLSFGAEIEVVSPPALRRQLAERARQVLAFYQDDGEPERRKKRPPSRS